LSIQKDDVGVIISETRNFDKENLIVFFKNTLRENGRLNSEDFQQKERRIQLLSFSEDGRL
jgi:hypothetical protein